MKIIKISMLALALGLMSFSAAEPINMLSSNTSASAASVSWKSETIDVGEILQNKPKEIVFEFKNTGKTTVIITNVQGSCGCTATEYTKTPILPGESGKVVATFNAAIVGAFSKTVTVTTNSSETPSVLTLKGTVKAAAVQG